jgi:FkbM family methyltransferase
VNRTLRSIAYVLQHYILRRRHLIGHARDVGVKLRFRSADVMGRHVYKYGVHEPDLTAFLLDSLDLGAGSVFVDIGANLGWYSLLVGRNQPAGVRIIAFEPDPDTFRLLCENLGLNDLDRIDARQLAVSDEPGRRVLFRYSDRNTGRHSLLPINEGGEVVVETTTLSRFVADEAIDPATIGLVKIDVEGYEPVVLRGMAAVLPMIPAILAEYSPRYMRRGGLDPADYLDPLFASGFVPCRLTAGRLAPVDRATLEARDTNANYFWLNTARRDAWPFDAGVVPGP